MSDSTFASRYNTRAIPVLNREFAVSVLFVRGTLTSKPMTARRAARFTISMGQELDVGIRTEQREYLLPLTGCILDGVQVQPLAGDVVIEGSEHWEVFVPDEATQASELSSTSHDWITQVRRIRHDGHEHC